MLMNLQRGVLGPVSLETLESRCFRMSCTYFKSERRGLFDRPALRCRRASVHRAARSREASGDDLWNSISLVVSIETAGT